MKFGEWSKFLVTDKYRQSLGNAKGIYYCCVCYLKIQDI